MKDGATDCPVTEISLDAPTPSRITAREALTRLRAAEHILPLYVERNGFFERIGRGSVRGGKDTVTFRFSPTSSVVTYRSDCPLRRWGGDGIEVPGTLIAELSRGVIFRSEGTLEIALSSGPFHSAFHGAPATEHVILSLSIGDDTGTATAMAELQSGDAVTYWRVPVDPEADRGAWSGALGQLARAFESMSARRMDCATTCGADAGTLRPSAGRDARTFHAVAPRISVLALGGPVHGEVSSGRMTFGIDWPDWTVPVDFSVAVAQTPQASPRPQFYLKSGGSRETALPRALARAAGCGSLRGPWTVSFDAVADANGKLVPRIFLKWGTAWGNDVDCAF